MWQMKGVKERKLTCHYQGNTMFKYNLLHETACRDTNITYSITYTNK